MNRRDVLAGLAVLPVLPSRAAPIARAERPTLSVTIDDFDLTDTALLSGEARDAAIRRTLARHRIKAAGFVAGKNIGTPLGTRTLAAWSRQGHLIGNHSFSHRYYSGADPAAAMADIQRCQALIAPYPGAAKLFRFPYLAEGRTAAGRNALRALLSANGYRNGHVTIDASDWFIDARLRARLEADSGADLAPYRRYYLAHYLDRAAYYDGLARKVFGRPIAHTLLLHHNLAAALFLGELLDMFRGQGWALVDAAAAFAQPEFARDFDTLPAGQSLAWAGAKAAGITGLRFPAEDGPYEASKMDALGL